MPNTREKLIELLDIIIQPGEKTLGDIADHLIANGVTVQKWIPVSERLPEAGIEVLAMLQVNKFDGHDAHNVVTAVRLPFYSWLVADYQEGIEAETTGTDCEECCYWITHWQPLPEPPKEEK